MSSRHVKGHGEEGLNEAPPPSQWTTLHGFTLSAENKTALTFTDPGSPACRRETRRHRPLDTAILCVCVCVWDESHDTHTHNVEKQYRKHRRAATFNGQYLRPQTVVIVNVRNVRHPESLRASLLGGTLG